MDGCTNFHTLSRWCWILRAKLRRKAGWASAPASATDLTGARKRAELGFAAPSFPTAGEPGLPPALLVRYLRHDFVVLGKTWQGLPPSPRFPTWPAVSPYRRLLRSGYEPIDWRQEFGRAPGEDIKLPWELARLQHLPQLAWHALCQRENLALVQKLAEECLSVAADFTLANPLNEGVNWSCAMDVSLRACNLLLAFDLLRAAGWEPEPEAWDFFTKVAVEHGRFVFDNLEWYRVGRGNHYLADIVGLLACALWLPRSRETDRWLGFAIAELGREIPRQFQSDGSNFEGSVFYHRLSLELLAFAHVLLAGVGPRKKRFSGSTEITEAPLAGALAFLRDLTDSSGHGVQFGDNDSGKLFDLSPAMICFVGKEMVDSLSNRATLSLDCLLLGTAAVTAEAQAHLWLLGKKSEPRKSLSFPSAMERRAPTPIVPAHAIEHRVALPALDPSALRWGQYPDFGLFFWRSASVEIWVRCGRPSGDGHHGHAHFDQLHTEIREKGIPLTFDPGSYAYTGDLAARNFFRGPEAHFLPRMPELESQARQDVDAFRYPGLPEGKCHLATKNEFVGSYQLGTRQVFRRLLFERGELRIWDWGDGNIVSDFPAPATVSWGYGTKIPFLEVGRPR